MENLPGQCHATTTLRPLRLDRCVARPAPDTQRLANHEAQSIEEGGVKEGVDGDS